MRDKHAFFNPYEIGCFPQNKTHNKTTFTCKPAIIKRVFFENDRNIYFVLQTEKSLERFFFRSTWQKLQTKLRLSIVEPRLLCVFFPKVTQSVAFCPADNSRQRLYSTGRQRTRTERSFVHALRWKRWSDNNDGGKKGNKLNERTRLIFDVLPVIWGAVWFRRCGLLLKSSDTHWILSQVRLNLLPAGDKWLWSALDGESKAGRVGCSPPSSWSEEPPQHPLSAFKLKARTGKRLMNEWAWKFKHTFA